MKRESTKRKPKKKGSEKRELVRKITGTLLDLLYPPRCPLCDKILDWKDRTTTQKIRIPGMPRGCCTDCRTSLPRVKEPACMKCGKPLENEGQEYCGECMTQRHFFDRGVAAFRYTNALRHSVYRMKTENRRDYIPFYAAEMARALERKLPQWRPEVILPAPMHSRKRRQRGYNQSELLAREIGRLTGIPVETGLLRVTRIIRSQKELGRRERLQNLRGSVAAREPFPRYSSVLLVDDVYTTGSTLDEISRVLRTQGVRSVYFVVLCTGKGKKDGMHREKSVVYSV